MTPCFASETDQDRREDIHKGGRALTRSPRSQLSSPRSVAVEAGSLQQGTLPRACVCVRACVRLYACAYVRACVFVRLCACACVRACACLRVRTCVRASLCVCVRVRVRACVTAPGTHARTHRHAHALRAFEAAPALTAPTESSGSGASEPSEKPSRRSSEAVNARAHAHQAAMSIDRRVCERREHD
eukprot:6180052-Pleurochrysis_carterae.AAC.2